jgi:Spy/CpxP family protein refolding chaperone
MLLGFKEELELSEEQVGRLEQIGEDHQALMDAQMERLREHREAMQQARADSDYDALERAADRRGRGTADRGGPWFTGGRAGFARRPDGRAAREVHGLA